MSGSSLAAPGWPSRRQACGRVLSREKTSEFSQTSTCVSSEKKSGRCRSGRVPAEGGKYGKRAVGKREDSETGVCQALRRQEPMTEDAERRKPSVNLNMKSSDA